MITRIFIVVLLITLTLVGRSQNQWNPSGTNIMFYTAGNVGIGTSNPLTRLHVNGSLTSNTVNLNESGINVGFLSRGASVTSGWSATPDVLAITYFQRDFAIGGWSKSDGSWKGASIFINSDNGLVGIGTTAPQAKLDVNGPLSASGGISSIISGSDLGGTISIINPAKTVAGTASTWKILNTSGSYGNALQFWAYDNAGCGTGLCSNRFTLMDNGNVGIGTVDTKGYKLAVNGSAIFTKAVVKSYAAWPDYVFEEGYKLLPLDSLESFIAVNKHLPDVPTAANINANGIDLGDNQTKLLAKTEELTLYAIQQNKTIVSLQDDLKSQSAVVLYQSKQINTQSDQLAVQTQQIEELRDKVDRQQKLIESLLTKELNKQD